MVAVAGWFVDDRAQAFSLRTAAWLAGAGVASLVAYLCMFYALQHGRLSIAVPIMSGWAVISTGISLLVLRDPVRPAQLAGAALVVAGVALVSRHAHQTAGAAASPDGGGDGDRTGAGPVAVPRWVWAALGAAVGFGFLIPAIGRVAPVTGHLGSVAAVFAVDVMFGLLLAAVLRIDLRPPPRDVMASVAFAGICEAGGFVCIALASARASLAVISPLASLSSALTVLYAWAVLRERPHRVALAGAVLACAGVIALAT
jgi:drug/metabolite transporter (DMT)-like permease